MTLDCPKCGTLLVPMVRYDTEIDYCPSCRGVWLDRDELEKLMTRESTYRPAARDDPGKNKNGFFRRLFDFD